MRYIFVFTLFFALAGCSTSPTETDKSVDKKSPDYHASLLLQAARGALLEKDMAAAFRYLQQAQDVSPKRAEVYHVRALAYLMKEDTKAAIAEMSKAYALAPRDSSINNTYGKILLDAGRFQEAEKMLTFAATDPLFDEAFKARTSLGILAYRTENYERAVHDFQVAIRENPENACISYYYLGHIETKRGELARATENYQMATQKVCAGFAEAHFALGLSLEKQKKNELARKKYLEVKQNFPESVLATKAIERLKVLQ